MLKYALFDYYPKRYLRRASFEESDVTRRILDFKDGRRYASVWAARELSRALAANDLSSTAIVCIPASCQRTHVRRYRRFASEFCRLSGAVNGFDHIAVHGHRRKAHIRSADGRPDGNISNVTIDGDFFLGRKVLVFDDICTTCRTANAFIEQMGRAGADVRMAVFLARTKHFKNYSYV